MAAAIREPPADGADCARNVDVDAATVAAVAGQNLVVVVVAAADPVGIGRRRKMRRRNWDLSSGYPRTDGDDAADGICWDARLTTTTTPRSSVGFYRGAAAENAAAESAAADGDGGDESAMNESVVAVGVDSDY